MTKLFTTWLLLAALSLDVVASNTDDPSDPVVASFERELNHEPSRATDVRRDDIDEDVLYAQINRALLKANENEADEPANEGEEQ